MPPVQLENLISGSGIRPLARGPPRGGLKQRWRMRQDHLCGRELVSKTAKKGAERCPSVPKAACGGLFRIAAGFKSVRPPSAI